MSSCYFVQTMQSRKLDKIIIPLFTRHLFNVSTARTRLDIRQIDFAGMATQAQVIAQSRDKTGVVPCFVAANSMLEMSDFQTKLEVGLQLLQNVQQRNRI